MQCLLEDFSLERVGRGGHLHVYNAKFKRGGGNPTLTKGNPILKGDCDFLLVRKHTMLIMHLHVTSAQSIEKCTICCCILRLIIS